MQTAIEEPLLISSHEEALNLLTASQAFPSLPGLRHSAIDIFEEHIGGSPERGTMILESVRFVFSTVVTGGDVG